MTDKSDEKDIMEELKEFLEKTEPLLAKPTEDGFLDEPRKPKFYPNCAPSGMS